MSIYLFAIFGAALVLLALGAGKVFRRLKAFVATKAGKAPFESRSAKFPEKRSNPLGGQNVFPESGDFRTPMIPPMIYFFGDVHGRFAHVLDLVNQDRPAAAVFLGDLQAQRPLEIELASIIDKTAVWFIHGNHDTDSIQDHDNLFCSALADRNLHGRVVEIDGLRVAGLGGVFRGQVWVPPGQWLHERPEDFAARCGKGNLWRGGLPRKHRSSIFPSDYLGLMGQRADILVTHEAPGSHPNGFDAIDALGRGMGVSTAFHGHQHDRRDYSSHRERLGFEAFGVGFCGVTDQHGRVVLAGEFDEARRTHQTVDPLP